MKAILPIVILFNSCAVLYGQESLSLSKSEVVFAKGLDLMAHGQHGAAREHFDKYQQLANKEDLRLKEAAYYQAFCAVKLYHPDGEKQLANFIAANPLNPLSVTAYYDMATFFYDEKSYTKATTYFGKTDFNALTAEQQNTGRFKWGYALFNLKKLDDALEQFSYIKAQGGQYGPAASYYAGYVEYTKGDYTNAQTDLKRAESNSSYATVVPYVLANVYYKQKQYDELIKYAASVEGRKGVANAEEIALLAAEAYFEKRDYTRALKGYKSYLEEKERADRGVLLRAGYAAFIARDENAANYLKTAALEQDSIGYYASYYLGAYYLQTQQKPLALLAFGNSRHFKSDPRVAEESSFQYAKVAYDLGRADEAITQLESFVTTYPESEHTTEAKELLGSAYVNASNYNRAIEYIENLAKTTPTIDKAYQKATFLKGTELFNKEQYAQAVDFFEKSLTKPVDPVYVAEASYWCAESYSIGRKYEQAIPHYSRVVSSQSSKDAALLAKTRYGLGYCYFNLKQYEQALYNFKEFVNRGKADPNYGDGLLRLADCYYIQKSYTEALSKYRQALQQKAADKDYAHLQSGIILGIQRKYNEALSELDEVVKNYNENPYADEAIYQRGQLFFEQGKYDQAAAEFTRLITRFPSSKFLPYAHMRRASSYYNMKEYDKTANDYITVVENFPRHPAAGDVLVPLQEALNLAGRSSDFDQYIAQYKTANPQSKNVEGVEFEAAKNLYFNQQYDKSARAFERYINSYPASPRLVEAKYYRAESFYRQGEDERSLAILMEISNERSFELSNRVTARIAEIQFKQGRYALAIPFFHRLAYVASNKKDQYNAWAGLMESHYLLAHYDSSAHYAQLILDKGNVNAAAQSKASLYLGKSAMGKGDYDAAKDEFLSTVNTARDEYGAEAKYRLGEIFYLNKEHKQCYETLVGLINDFSAYEEWVGKAFLLLADNFLAEDNVFQAKGTLTSLEDFPLEHIKTQARQKLKAIESEELRKKEVADTTGN